MNRLALILVLILFSCSKEESEVLPTEIPSEKLFNLIWTHPLNFQLLMT